MAKKNYIYALIDPRSMTVRYVGKTNCIYRRLIGHRYHARNTTKTHKAAWMRSLMDVGLCPLVQILEETSEEAAPEAEVKWIAYYRAWGCDLTNLTDGGEGTPGGNIGNKNWMFVTPEGRQRQRDAVSGRVESDETRLKKSLSHIGKPSGMLGHRHSEETKARIAESVRKNRPHYKHTEETRKKLSEAKKGYTPSDEARRNMSAAGKLRWERVRQEKANEQRQSG